MDLIGEDESLMIPSLKKLRKSKELIEKLLTSFSSSTEQNGIDALFLVNSNGIVEMADSNAYGNEPDRLLDEYNNLFTAKSFLDIIESAYLLAHAAPLNTVGRFGKCRGVVFSFDNSVVNCRFYGRQVLEFGIVSVIDDWRDFRYAQTRDSMDRLEKKIFELGASGKNT